MGVGFNPKFQLNWIFLCTLPEAMKILAVMFMIRVSIFVGMYTYLGVFVCDLTLLQVTMNVFANWIIHDFNNMLNLKKTKPKTLKIQSMRIQ